MLKGSLFDSPFLLANLIIEQILSPEICRLRLIWKPYLTMTMAAGFAIWESQEGETENL